MTRALAGQKYCDGRLAFASSVVCRSGAAGAAAEALVEAFAAVPREVFVDKALASRSQEDVSLPIGFGQTISKPSTVAYMLSQLGLEPGERVLEVGVGSGYVLAVVAAMGTQACGVEKIAPLAQIARRRLDQIGLSNVLMRAADGFRGWPELAPFDAIIVSAAIERTPEELLRQLSPHGRLIAPVTVESNGAAVQRLRIWRKSEGMRVEDLGPCHFVAAT